MSKINYANKVALNIDPSVAAINKCQADDMNSIKNAINQGGSFTPLTINTNTGVFYCSLEGTLATNDIVKVNVPTTIGSANWYVSVDNDTTNYVVLYEDGTNVKPVDVSEKNVELYFNGTNFVLIGSGVENSYSTSTTKPYSCSYVNGLISGTILYDNATGSNTSVTLTDDPMNYDYLEIDFKTNDDTYHRMKFPNPYGSIELYVARSTATGTGSVFLKCSVWSISGNVLNSIYHQEVNIKNNASPTISGNNQTTIVKVIGYSN